MEAGASTLPGKPPGSNWQLCDLGVISCPGLWVSPVTMSLSLEQEGMCGPLLCLSVVPEVARAAQRDATK